MCWLIDNRETSSSPASPMLLPTRSRIRSDSFNGWFRLRCPTNIVASLADSRQRSNQDILPRVLTLNFSFERPQVQVRGGGFDGNDCTIRHQQRIELDVNVTRTISTPDVANRFCSRRDDNLSVSLIVVLDHSQNRCAHCRAGG